MRCLTKSRRKTWCCRSAANTKQTEKIAVWWTMNDNQKTAEKFRKLADGLTAKIANCRRPMTQAHTPKRGLEYQSRLIEGDRLERVQRALSAMAACHECGVVPDVLRGLKTKSDIEPLVSTIVEHPDYYSLRDTGNFRDQGVKAIALRELMNAGTSAEEKEKDAERQKDSVLQAKIDRLRLCNISGFYPTPRAIIDLMMDKANIDHGERILEPSAGIGSILDVILEKFPQQKCPSKVDYEVVLVAVEQQHSLIDILQAKGYGDGSGKSRVCVGDFLEMEPHTIGMADVVMMNPPFERMQDVDHVQHAWRFLKDGGRLVAVMSPSAFQSSNSKAAAFMDWFNANGLESERLPDKSFDSIDAFRRTGVSAMLVWGTKS